MSDLADRMRMRFAGDPRVTEKRAFGGIMFLLNGNMIGAAKMDGRMLVHVDKADHDELSQREGAESMIHNERIMRGFIWVEDYAIESNEDLDGWLTIAERCAASLPPKAAKPAAKKAPAKKAARAKR